MIFEGLYEKKKEKRKRRQILYAIQHTHQHEQMIVLQDFG